MTRKAARGPDAIRGVILDYGQVLCRPPDQVQMVRIAEALGLEVGAFAARYQRERGLYDRGDLTAASYWSRIAARNGELNDGLLAKVRGWDVEMWINLDPVMVRWLKDLSEAGFKTAVLSNMHPDMAAYARQNFVWLHRLDCVILSCEVRLVKPERAIYGRCVEDLGLRPAEVLFIDDREVNVLAAKEAGLTALQFKSTEQLSDALAQVHFPLLPTTQSNRPSEDQEST